jgi:hypothetical protein
VSFDETSSRPQIRVRLRQHRSSVRSSERRDRPRDRLLLDLRHGRDKRNVLELLYGDEGSNLGRYKAEEGTGVVLGIVACPRRVRPGTFLCHDREERCAAASAGSKPASPGENADLLRFIGRQKWQIGQPDPVLAGQLESPDPCRVALKAQSLGATNKSLAELPLGLLPGKTRKAGGGPGRRQ